MNIYRISFNTADAFLPILAQVLKDRIEQRWDTRVEFGTPADLTLECTGIEGREGEICAAENGYRLSAGEMCHLWDLCGRLLRSAPNGGAFRPSVPCGTVTPAKEVCGMYFATHFHNFYHAAPMDKVCRYIEDLALWGMEVLYVWFDMHAYTGTNDPAAQKMADRLRSIMRHGKKIGIKTAFGGLANEGFSTTPDELRATAALQNGYTLRLDGFYGTEVCPSKPGGMELILKNLNDELDLFEDTPPDQFRIWPYDQGGCTCDGCAPWGCNGYLRTCKAIYEVIRARLPKTKIIISTWYFGQFLRNDTEWDGLYAAFERGELDFVDGMVVDFPHIYPQYVLTHPQPCPILSFNEISMYGATPWGGYGANPMPAHIEEQWNDAGNRLSGGTPYSEGIFEDLNKAITLRLFREEKPADETIREYLRYECGFAEENLDKGVELIRKMEIGLYRDSFGFQHKEKEIRIWHPEQVESALALAEELDKALPADRRDAFRWQQILIRCRIDAELTRNGNAITPSVIALFERLDEMYYTQNGSSVVRPFVSEAIAAREKRCAMPGWHGNPVFWWEQKDFAENTPVTWAK